MTWRSPRIWFFAGALFAAGAAHAETASIGLLLGAGLRSSEGTGLGFELKGGYRLLPAVMTSVYYWDTSGSSDVITATGSAEVANSATVSSYGLEALYTFVGSRWSVGAKLGLMTNTISGSAVDALGDSVQLADSNSSFALAPTVVYEVPVGQFSAGVEAAYFIPFSSSVVKVLSVMASARLRF